MNKKLKITSIIIIIIIVLVILFFSGIISSLNHPLNRFIAGEPDKSCNSDSDCVLRDTNCHVCNCGEAVNKKWKTFCPFPPTRDILNIACEKCYHYDFEIKCVENQCQMKSLNK